MILNKIKHFENPGMKLIGFKSKNCMKIYQNIRPSYFIYPDEGVVKGSSKMFHALINSLVKKDKIAYVRFVAREGAMVRFCYLVPQRETGIQDGEIGQYTPPGFHLIFLPYAEDVREIEDHLAHQERLPETSKEDERTAKLFVKNMSIDFDSRNFENPSIQKFYSGLQSFALDEKNPEEVQDMLEPDYEGMEKMKEIIDKMKDTFDLDVVPKAIETKPKNSKRSKHKILNCKIEREEENKSELSKENEAPEEKLKG